jgi:hypothetical protein
MLGFGIGKEMVIMSEINTYIQINKTLKKIYPIPYMYKKQAKYYRIRICDLKAYLYDADKKYLCSIDQTHQ